VGTTIAAALERRPWVKPLVLSSVSVAVGWLIVRFVGSIDWAQVGAAISRLTAYNWLLLAVGLAVRQSFNAVPLSRFVPELPFRRSVVSDLGANVVGTFAPPPSDVVLRVSMFNTWGINPVDGMAGVTMNTLAFYAVRFLAPVLGLLVISGQEIDRRQWIAALISALVAAAVIGALLAVMRGDRIAAWIGRTAARIVRRFRKGVDAEAWATAVVHFRGRMNVNLRAGLVPSLVALMAMVITDSLILLGALRAVGVASSQLPVTDIVGAFLIAYPLTLMPLFGLGVMDAALLASYTAVAGTAWEPDIVAALAVWRVTTIGGQLLLGAIAIAAWRRSTRASHPA